MKAFADLYSALDETNKTNDKQDALVAYLGSAPPADAAWAVYFLIGRKPKQVVPMKKLREWARELADIPEWLFGESYDAVGDIAETITLLLPEHATSDDRALRYWVEERLLPLRRAPEAEQRASVLDAWASMDQAQRFVWNKLITGAFRVGVSARLVTRALAVVGDLEDSVVAHRLMGDWQPTAEWYSALLAHDTADADYGRPYPFCLAYPTENPADLGERNEWQAEWKWDGIRAQLIRRAGQTFLWSRGEENLTENFPDLVTIGDRLPDGTVMDGEVLPWSGAGVLPFAQLQKRITRKTLSRKILADIPAIFMAYDLLEDSGADIRELPLHERRRRLEGRVADGQHDRLLLSQTVAAATWDALAEERDAGRERNVEGLMLKRLSSPYRVGRVKGDWWKWKVEPYTIDAVLIYAQRGSGKRASLYTDYTFGVWDAGQLVPFTKAYSGLTDAEIRQVDQFVRRNTLEKFGPVRTVKAELVFELAFEGIQRSNRHKSGIAVRFPRILRWRHDKPIAEADSLETIQALLPPEPPQDDRA